MAMYRNLVTSLLRHERVQTTDAKAKGVRRIAERMITLGKRGDLHARRRALRVIREREVAAKVFDELADRYRDRPGGYTRILKLGPRVGDAAPISIIELVDRVGEGKTARKKTAGKKAAKKAPAKKAAAAKDGKPEPAAKKKAPAKKKPAARKKTAKKAGASKATGAKTAKKKSASRKKTTRKK
jgi:large subunit ribosomal protein L17